jgi:hypothetical protein
METPEVCMYEGKKKAIGPIVKKCAQLKSVGGVIINKKKKQMDRLVKLYLEMYSKETKLTDTVLNAMDTLPTLDHFDTFQLWHK